ncbi:TPA: hypothetical protein N0F65_006687 [Lagenidium giganteum]|uniref:Uncharacterized protein n=1 Tax=Lagenidium giganteum TaxID=4803 RepID=A0AAV2Z8V0_9STRA|nr:TPA: hypothetical protein N0F65_006687 [Lagenidium giganteum]
MKFHIFRMRNAEHPSAPVVSIDVRKKYDDIVVSSERVMQIWNKAESIPPGGVNPEKVTDLFKHIYLYIPEAYRDDPLYASPTPEEKAAAAAIK